MEMQPVALLSRCPTAPGIAVILLAASLGIPGMAWPEDNAWERRTLKGIEVVRVLVEQVPPDAERDGLTQADLQAEVEARLRQAGIPVAPMAGTDFLYVNVFALKKLDDGFYVFSIDVQFRQLVSLNRDPSIGAIATTWSVYTIGTVGAKRLRDVRATVTALVDRFITAYREQNPKP